MHTIAVLAVDGVIAFDLSTPLEVFGRSGEADGKPLYELVVAGPRRQAAAGPMSIHVPHTLARISEADTVIIPGVRRAAVRSARALSPPSAMLPATEQGLPRSASVRLI